MAEERKRIALEIYKKAIDESGNVATEDYLNIAHSLYYKIEKKLDSNLLSILDKLSLPDNCKLEIELAKEIGIGDKSKLYIDQDGIYDTKIWEYIKVDDSPMGAWQAFCSIPHGVYYLCFGMEDMIDVHIFIRQTIATI